MNNKMKLTIQELTYIISLAEFKELVLIVNNSMFQKMNNNEYELFLIALLKQKCDLVIKDY